MTDRKPGEMCNEVVVARDRAMGEWLNEITLLASELVVEVDDNGTDTIDRETIALQVQHLHDRLWKMRHHFGFSVDPTQDGES
jgi:hypothetical protein